MGKKRSPVDERQLPTASNLSSRGYDKPDEVLKVCLPGLRKQFNRQNLGFSRADRAARIRRYVLSGVDQQSGTAREKYPILPLCRSVDEIYWAGITVDFQCLNSSNQLIDAGIIIFKGAGFAVKVPVLRAEWHCSDDYLQAIHAQPHWHVYHPQLQRLGVGFSPGAPKDFAPGEQVEDKGESEAQLMRFHFAMSAAWQRGEENAHIAAITSVEALGNWLSGCLSYIVGQLS
jgi:hypothetical protein